MHIVTLPDGTIVRYNSDLSGQLEFVRDGKEIKATLSVIANHLFMLMVPPPPTDSYSVGYGKQESGK